MTIVPYSRFGLTGMELRRHIRDLREQGWQPWELAAVFGRTA